jgi:LPS export ABC transporter protein LptC
MIKFFMKRSVLLVLALMAFSLFSYYVLKGESGMKLAIHPKGESYIEGLRLVHKKDGGNDWVLNAKRADISQDGGAARLSGIEMTIKGKGVTVYADKGVYNMNDKSLVVDGRVVAKGADYSIISDNGARFDGTANSLNTGGNVTVESPKFSVKGRGMATDNNGQIVRILGNVEAVFSR